MPLDAPAVLFVDDEPALLRAMVRAVADLPVRPICASSVDEALERLAREPIRLVLCDFDLGGTNGLQLRSAILERWPSTRFVLHTGSAVPWTFGVDVAILAKPADADSLRQLVWELSRDQLA